MGRHLDGRHPSRLHGQLAQIMLDVVGQRLGIGGTARPAAPDAIVELGDLVGDAVGHVRAGGDAGVGTEDDAAGEGDGHDGGSRGDFAGTEVARFGRLAVVGVRGGHHGGCVMVRKGVHIGLLCGNRERWYLREERHRRLWRAVELGFDPDFRHLGLRDQQQLDLKFFQHISCLFAAKVGKSATPRELGKDTTATSPRSAM